MELLTEFHETYQHIRYHLHQKDSSPPKILSLSTHAFLFLNEHKQRNVQKSL